MYTIVVMNTILSLFIISILSLLVAPQALASTTIDVSNNGGGSSNSVTVHNSTSTNSTGSSGTSKNTTKIIIDGKTVVDDTKESTDNQETNISVKKQGDAEPSVFYEVKKTTPKVKSQEVISNEVKEKQAELRKKIEANRAETEKKVLSAVAKQEITHASLLTKMEDLLARLRSIFSH